MAGGKCPWQSSFGACYPSGGCVWKRNKRDCFELRTSYIKTCHRKESHPLLLAAGGECLP